MEISSQQNSYQAMNQYQKPITTPVEPNDPKYTNKEVYEASQGNVIRNDESELALTPQGQTNLTNAQDEKSAEVAQASQEQKDSQRATATDYLARKSTQSQVEIYLAVGNDTQVSSQDDTTATVLQSLRDVQKQNNAVEAYASYKENSLFSA